MNAGTAAAVEKPHIIASVAELDRRLRRLETDLALMRSDVLGESEPNDVPERISPSSLEARVVELHRILDDCEVSIARLMAGIGVQSNAQSDCKTPAPSLRRGAAYEREHSSNDTDAAIPVPQESLGAEDRGDHA
jgi:hypothetical protein